MRLCVTQAACEDAEAVREEKGPGLVDGIAVCSHSRKGARLSAGPMDSEGKTGLELGKAEVGVFMTSHRTSLWVT